MAAAPKLMTPSHEPDPAAAGTENNRAGGPVFVTTHWSVVLSAGNDSTRSREALTQLCQTYWRPLYAYVRRRGYSSHDAEDLTQEFFARLLQRQAIGKADPQRGRFRSFLLASLKNFLADEWDKAHAQKRGGAAQVLSLDFKTEERHLTAEPADIEAPDKLYEKRWGMALLNRVYGRLEEEFCEQDKASQFIVLRQTLTAPRGTAPYAELAMQLGMSEGAVKVAVHRLRKRYRELLHQTIAETVSTPEEVEEELRYLLQVLAS